MSQMNQDEDINFEDFSFSLVLGAAFVTDNIR